MSQKGFSLIELMVAVMVAGIIIAIGLPSYVGFKKTLHMNQTRERMVQDLRYARQLAVTRHRQVIMTFGVPPTTTNILTYNLHIDTDGDRVVDTGESVVTRSLPDGSKLSAVSLTPTDSLIFDSSGALAPGSTGGTIIFVNALNRPDTLWISGVGMVYTP